MPNVGLVILSHSKQLAAGVKELAAQMGGPDVKIAAVGGTEDGGIGTNPDAFEAAVKEVSQGAGVAVLVDLGSAVLTVKAYLAEDEAPDRVVIVDAPLVEGAVGAAVSASGGADLDAVVAAAEESRGLQKVS